MKYLFTTSRHHQNHMLIIIQQWHYIVFKHLIINTVMIIISDMQVKITKRNYATILQQKRSEAQTSTELHLIINNKHSNMGT